jgi:hypothetical protein
MAVGDQAAAAGFPLVDPATDLVKDGATEINRTRDLVADTLSQIPVGVPAFQSASGILIGSAAPINDAPGAPGTGVDGNIYFKYTP